MDGLDAGKRFIKPDFVDFSTSSDGFVQKPSAVLQYGS